MSYNSSSQPFLYGGTLLSYLNFRGTPIILINNNKIFTENLSMISQFSSQNHGDLYKNLRRNSRSSLRISRTKTAKFDVPKYFFFKSFAAHLETDRQTDRQVYFIQFRINM